MQIIGYLNVYRDEDGDIVAGCIDLYDTRDEAHSSSAAEFDGIGRKYLGVAAVVLEEGK